MVADDMREELKALDDDCLKAIIGYCEGILDCRPEETEAKSVKITIRGGCFQDIEGLPPGYDYEVNDLDNKEAG